MNRLSLKSLNQIKILTIYLLIRKSMIDKLVVIRVIKIQMIIILPNYLENKMNNKLIIYSVIRIQMILVKHRKQTNHHKI